MAELRASFKMTTNRGLFEQHVEVNNARESWITPENIIKELSPFIEGLVQAATPNMGSNNGQS